MKFLILILKNLRRNMLRSLLTAFGMIALIVVVTLVWSVLFFLDEVTEQKSQNLKAIISERWLLPSQMPFVYAATLSEGAVRQPDDIRPTDSMTWQFYVGTLDPKNLTFENVVVAIAMEPQKMLTMMDDLDSLPAEQASELQHAIDKMNARRQGIIIGQTRLKSLNKRVGEAIKVSAIGGYKGLDLEFEIVGTFPPGRYDQSSVMNRDYLNAALDEYPRSHRGQKHAMADRSLNLVWVRVPDTASFSRVADQIARSPNYSTPAVKIETASAGVSTFLESYRDLIFGMKWLLGPAILITMSLVSANAISISVRERRLEMAVLKVLGFRPEQILVLVLGEAVAVGTLAGVFSSTATYLLVNFVAGGLKFPIAFFPAFFIPVNAIWWGAAIGFSTSLAGSILPAWSARTVKVSEAFSKVT